MILLNVPLNLAGLIAVWVLLVMLAMLSRRLGEVTKMRPYYRAFYAAMLGVTVAAVASLVRRPGSVGDGDLVAYYVPLTLAGLVSLVVALRYWGWLFRERRK